MRSTYFKRDEGKKIREQAVKLEHRPHSGRVLALFCRKLETSVHPACVLRRSVVSDSLQPQGL